MKGFPDTENLQKIAEIIQIFCQKNIKYKTHPNIKSKNILNKEGHKKKFKY